MMGPPGLLNGFKKLGSRAGRDGKIGGARGLTP